MPGVHCGIPHVQSHQPAHEILKRVNGPQLCGMMTAKGFLTHFNWKVNPSWNLTGHLIEHDYASTFNGASGKRLLNCLIPAQKNIKPKIVH